MPEKTRLQALCGKDGLNIDIDKLLEEMVTVLGVDTYLFDAGGALLCCKCAASKSDAVAQNSESLRRVGEEFEYLRGARAARDNSPLIYFTGADTIRISAPVFSKEQFEGAIILGNITSKNKDDVKIVLICSMLRIYSDLFSQLLHLRRIEQLTRQVEEKLEKAENRLRRLARDMEQAVLSEKKARITSQYIVDLFESAGAVAEAAGENMTAGLLDCLTDFLARNLESASTVSTLGEELRYIENYLELTKACRGATLDIKLEIDTDLEDAILPAFSIHPFVDRAVTRGLFRKSGHGQLAFSAKLVNGAVRIEIIDDGIGMDDEKMLALKSFGRDSYPERNTVDIRFNSSIGTHNALILLSDKFGSQFSWDIESQIGKGTKVTLEIPYMSSGSNNIAI